MTITNRTIGTVAALAGLTVMAAVLPPVAHADPVLDPIIATVNGDRANTRCPGLTYSPALEAVAQRYARSELLADSRTDGVYQGETSVSLGSGDPQAAAVNSAYRRGAGRDISQCRFTDFGVGFVRHEDRSVDVVTIIFGAPVAPPPAPATPTPATVPMTTTPMTTSTQPPAADTARITGDVDVYDEPGGVGSPVGVLADGTIVTVVQRRDDNWVELAGIGWVWGDFVGAR